MKVAFSATNPCHLYDLACALHGRGALGMYFSGYPRWRLRPPPGFPLQAHSARTLLTYSLLRVPHGLRPRNDVLFRWQDDGFDRAVARDLTPAAGQILHAMPGQALASFRRARNTGIATCLNHASGPVRQQLAVLEPEYERLGLKLQDYHAFDRQYLSREDAEYSLSDRHCVASSIVRRQLVLAGVPEERIWIVPYGAEPRWFHQASDSSTRNPTHVVFAGQIAVRKGLRVLHAAMQRTRASIPVTAAAYGTLNADMRASISQLASDDWFGVHPPVSHARLGEIFRRAGMLVLPSWEEAFGLVVVQALACGLPCVISDRVGAADLIQHRVNGSIFPAGDAEALATEIAWWTKNGDKFQWRPQGWDRPAEILLTYTKELLLA